MDEVHDRESTEEVAARPAPESVDASDVTLECRADPDRTTELKPQGTDIDQAQGEPDQGVRRPAMTDSTVETTTIVGRAEVDDWLLGILDASESAGDQAKSGRGPWLDATPRAAVETPEPTAETTSIVNRDTVDSWIREAGHHTSPTTPATRSPAPPEKSSQQRFTYTRSTPSSPQSQAENDFGQQTVQVPPPGSPRQAPVAPGGQVAPGLPPGSVSNWNYADGIRQSEWVPVQRRPPERGWRKAVYLGSLKLFNPGLSPDEVYQGKLEAIVQAPLRGRFRIGVLGKGGVGKSTIAAGVGSIFAALRPADGVVAVDADTAFGKLASRIDPSARGSYWDLAADGQVSLFADVRARIGSNTVGLSVLPGAADVTGNRVLDATVYRAAVSQLDRFFALSIIDFGSTLDTPVTMEALSDVDVLIVVSSPWYDGASAAGQTLQWLSNSSHAHLLQRTLVVINDSDGHAAKTNRKLLAERFGERGLQVIEVPYDEHLRPGGVIDVVKELNRTTRRRLLELAAHSAQYFTAVPGRQ